MSRRFGSIEEHPRGSGLYRLRSRVGGRLLTLAGGVDGAVALPAAEELVPSGRVVYFVRSGAMVKIGWSDDVNARLRQLQTATHERLELLATCPGGRALEAFLHAAFTGFRGHGEWFHFCDRVAHCVFVLKKISAREAA